MPGYIAQPVAHLNVDRRPGVVVVLVVVVVVVVVVCV